MRTLRVIGCLVAVMTVAGVVAADGSGTISYTDGATDGFNPVYVGSILQLTMDAGDDRIPGWGCNPWSPAGDKIVYQGDPEDLYVINADGSGFGRLTNNDRCNSHASFVPGATERVVFQRNVSGYARVMIGTVSDMLADPAGYVATNLTDAHGGPVNDAESNGSGCEQKPMVSPDGARIAFRACDGHYDYDAELWVMNIDGSSPARVADGTYCGNHHSWSPDSQWIVFAGAPDGDDVIYKVFHDGSQPPVELFDPEDAFGCNWPAWSPDGQWIAFHTDNGDGEIRLIGADGTIPANHVLVAGGAVIGRTILEWVDAQSRWSPDNEWVVFRAWNGGDTYDSIFAVSVVTGTTIQLTSGNDDRVHWFSADGTKILFRDRGAPSRDGDQYDEDLLVANTDSSQWNRLSQQARAVPVLGGWGMALLLLLTTGAGVILLRRR